MFVCKSMYIRFIHTIYNKKKKKLKRRNKRQRKIIGSSVLCLRWCVHVCGYDFCQCVCVCVRQVRDQIRSAPYKSITTSTTTIRVKTWVRTVHVYVFVVYLHAEGFSHCSIWANQP